MHLFLRPYGPVCILAKMVTLCPWFIDFFAFLHINKGKTLNYTRYTQFVKKRISNKIEAKAIQETVARKRKS